MKVAQFFFTATATIFLLIADAQAGNVIFQAKVTADSLNIRERPNSEASVIGTLEKGQTIIGSHTYNGWVMTIATGRIGYVSGDHVKLLRVLSTGSDEDTEEKCNSDTANLDLKITNVDFDCDKSFSGYGFRSCNANINVSINSDCDEDMSASVWCDAEFSYRRNDSYLSSYDTESTSSTVYISYGSGQTYLDISWHPFLRSEPITKVQLADVSCRISSVYD